MDKIGSQHVHKTPETLPRKERKSKQTNAMEKRKKKPVRVEIIEGDITVEFL